MKNHTRLWIVLSLILVFISGVATGILVDKYIQKQRYKKAAESRRGPHFPTLDALAEELRLTPDQRAEIQKIFKNNEDKLHAMREQIHKQYSENRTQLRNEIKSVLSDEQWSEFESIVEKYSNRRRKDRGNDRPTAKEQKKGGGNEKATTNWNSPHRIKSSSGTAPGSAHETGCRPGCSQFKEHGSGMNK